MIRLSPLILIAILGSVLVSSCLRREVHPPWVSNIIALKEPIGPEEIFIIPQGEKVSFDRLIDGLESAKVIFVGESHDQIEHHQTQLKILRTLLARGKEVVVGMEMFHSSQQPVLDRWSQGNLTEREFRKEVNWETTWGTDYQLYKGILDEVKDRHLKLLGLNVDRSLVSKVAEKGIEGLPPEDRERLPEMDLSDRDHRAYIRNFYGLHEGGQAKDFKRFYESQCLWDEGMAETLSRFLKSPECDGKILLVLAGNGHIIFDFGIPKRFYRRTPFPFKTIVLKEWGREADRDLLFSSPSSSLADFLWITKPNPPEQRRPRIGVFLKEGDGSKGLWIERVVPDSPAEKAGLHPGDQLIAVEGMEISEIEEIHEALSRKGWGKDISLTILREGMKKEITVTLPPLKE